MPSLRSPPPTHQGVEELMRAAAGELAGLPPSPCHEPDYVPGPPEIDTSGEVSIEKVDDVDGGWALAPAADGQCQLGDGVSKLV